MSVDLLSGESENDAGVDVEEAATATETDEAAPLSADEGESEAEASEEASPEEPNDGRPEGCPEKFWDSENGIVRTDAVLKSYAELEKKLGADSKDREVPDAYEFEIPAYDDLKDDLGEVHQDDFEAVTSLMEPDCAFNKSMQDRAREAKVSQEQWKTLAKGFVIEQARAHKLSEKVQFKELLKEEGGDKKKLGERVAGVRNTIYSVYRDNPGMKAHAHHMSQTADGVRLLEDVFSGRLAAMVRGNGSSAPIPTNGAKQTRLTVADLRQMQSTDEYQNGDKTMMKRVEAGYKSLEQAGAL